MEGRKNQETQKGAENREKQGEVIRRVMVLARDIEGFKGKTPKELFDSQDEKARRETLAALSSEQYCQLITGVNGVLRGKKKEDWNMDGVGVTAAGHEVIGAHIFPRHEDKKEIIEKSWDAAQRMNGSGRDLEEIGMLLGSMLVETHPFADGNGRTSRLVYSMVKEGFSEEKLREILGEYGREEFDMALTKVYIDQLFKQKLGLANAEINPAGIHGILPDEEGPYGKLHFPEGVDPEVQYDIIQAGRNDEIIFPVSILHFLQTHQEISTDAFVKMYGKRKVFLVQRLLSAIPAEQVKELEETYWNIKKIYTEDMIDIFVNPDKPEYKIQQDGEEVRMIDIFKQRIAEGVMLL